jgi:hypothetical protein
MNTHSCSTQVCWLKTLTNKTKTQNIFLKNILNIVKNNNNNNNNKY